MLNQITIVYCTQSKVVKEVVTFIVDGVIQLSRVSVNKVQQLFIDDAFFDILSQQIVRMTIYFDY